MEEEYRGDRSDDDDDDDDSDELSLLLAQIEAKQQIQDRLVERLAKIAKGRKKRRAASSVLHSSQRLCVVACLRAYCFVLLYLFTLLFCFAFLVCLFALSFCYVFVFSVFS